jgi:hypothetical protein
MTGAKRAVGAGIAIAILLGMLAWPAAAQPQEAAAPADDSHLPKTVRSDAQGDFVVDGYGNRIPVGFDPTIQKIVDETNEWGVYTADYEIVNLSQPDRRTGSSQYKAVMDYMKQKFESYGLYAMFDDWSTYRNVIAYQNGTDTSSKSIVVTGGHCDTVANAPGADDDGSGCAASMYLASILSKYKFRNTIVYQGYDAEEIGLVGSKHWAQAEKAKGTQISGAYITDMIAVDSSPPAATQIRARSADQFMADILIKCNTDYAIGIPSLKVGSGPGSSDHASFQQQGYNAILLIEESLNGDLHTPRDTMDKVNVKWYGQNTKVQACAIATAAIPDSGGGGGSIATIEITPATATVVIGQQKQFQAVAKDANGTPVPATFTWAASGGGTIDTSGTYSAQSAGVFTIYANASGKSGTAQVTVAQSGQLASIDVTPTPVIMTADETKQFQATGRDAAGNIVSITPTWTADKGTITQQGLYTPAKIPAGKPSETDSVHATVGSISGSAVITIFPGLPVTLAIDPTTATITADATQAFTVTGKDKQGNDIPDPAVAWSADNGKVTKTGNNTGTFTPDKVGDWKVKATSQTGTLEAVADVKVTPGKLANAFIDPKTWSMKTGETKEFAVSGKDGKGNEITTLTVKWLPVVGGIGTVDQNGKFTAEKAGTGKVQAEVSDPGGTKKTVSADVTVTQGTGGGGGGGASGFNLGDLMLPLIIIIVVVIAAIAAMAMTKGRRKKEQQQAQYWQQGQQGYAGYDQQQQQWQQPPQGGGGWG